MKFKRLRQINRILSKEEKKDGAKLLIMIMAMGIFDVLGVASILPFMSVASDSSFIESNQLAMEIYNYLGFDDHKSFVMFSGLSVITLIITSTIFKLMTNYTYYSLPVGYWYILYISVSVSVSTRNVINTLTTKHQTRNEMHNAPTTHKMQRGRT